jgi:cytochrome c5
MDWGKLEDLANAVAELAATPSDSMADADRSASRKRALPAEAEEDSGAAAVLQKLATGERVTHSVCFVCIC